ncbi:MAG: glycosyltransferase family 2 protein [Candidatus Limnocylindria bacterium]
MLPRTSAPLLSVLIPVYNEERTIREIVRRVRAIDLPKEVIVVDDGSTDGTRAALAEMDGITVIGHERNAGKGAAVSTALARARGEVFITQDADLEYDPSDIPALYSRYLEGDTDAVFGSRVLSGGRRHSSVLFYWGGRLVSLITSLLYGTWITDEPTGYKLVRTDLARSLDLRASGFDFCPELTARILRRGGRIVEVPIRYDPRSWAQGKKITARDGLLAIWVLVRERFA